MATVEKHATYEVPGREGSPVELKPTYDNFIRGHWVAPTNGKYRDNVTPVTGEPFCQVAPVPGARGLGGYKVSGVGRETHKMMLDHYSHQVPAGQLRPEATGLLLAG